MTCERDSAMLALQSLACRAAKETAGACTQQDVDKGMRTNEIDESDVHRDTDFADDAAFLASKGYQVVRKLADSLQGQVFLAESLRSPEGQAAAQVSIKRVDKILCEHKMALEDEDGMNEFVDEDVLQEAAILEHLTVRNRATSDHVVKFVALLESDTHFFLVTQFVAGITLGKFAQQAHDLIDSGKLSRKEWLKTVKFVMWQLSAAMHWLHEVYGCCHLDLCMSNVLLENAEFEPQPDGSRKPPQRLAVKIIDFGVAEIFESKPRSFACWKDRLSIDNGAYIAPEAFAGVKYDARKADTWALGMILYRLATNAPPFVAEDIWDEGRNGYAALKTDRFGAWLRANKVHSLLGKNAASLLVSLLKFDEDRRPLAGQAMQARWFKAYAQRFGAVITRQMARDRALMR